MLHRDEREHLEQVVLSDIAQGTDAIVEWSALLHADFLQYSDADTLDELVAPRDLEKIVGKSESQDVLEHFFGKVVIDAIDLPFFEKFAKHFVDLFGRREVHAKRLLDDDMRPALIRLARIGQPRARELAEYELIKFRSDREIEQLVGADAPFGIELVECLFEIIIARCISKLPALEFKNREKRREYLLGYLCLCVAFSPPLFLIFVLTLPPPPPPQK